MRFGNLVVVVAVASTVAACAGMGRIESYPHGFADAKVRVGSRAFSVWLHRKEPTVMVQRGFGAGMGQAFASGLTLNAVNLTEPMPYWKAAAQAVLTPIGCTVSDVYTLDNRSTWEARYTCPAGVDVDAYVEAHRDELRKGIEVPDPMHAAPAG